MPFFHEEQRFRQPLVWTALVIATVASVGLIGTGMIQQLIYHVPFGKKPMSDVGLALFGTGILLLMFGVVWLFLSARLVLEVRDDGVYVRFYPFHRRFHWFQFSDIIAADAEIYSPLREFGGWGIRYGRNGKAYNVSGNRGVRLTFGNGRTLMLGSRRPEELAAAIEAARISAPR